MTIGLLLDDTLDKPDGVQQAVIAIGEELRIRGNDVHYLVSDTARTDLANVHSIAKYFSLKFNGNSVRTPLPVKRSMIRKLLADIKFDVLHVQMPYSPLFTARVLKLAPSKITKVGTFHILPYNFFTTLGTKLLGYALFRNRKLLTYTFAVSKPANKFMESSFGLVGEVLANPVDYSFYSKFKKQKTNKKQIVFVGRFEKRKGVRELLEAYAALPSSVREKTALTMCGKGPLLEEMRTMAQEKQLTVAFPGFVSDEQKAQFLSNADIAVFPSTGGESFGIVLTEAMSAGSGITIGGNNPGYSSVLADWSETLFNPKDIRTFAEKLKRLLADNGLRESIGKQQHEAAKQYDIHTIVDRLEKTYRGK